MAGVVKVERDLNGSPMTYWYPADDPESSARAETLQSPGRAISVVTYGAPGVGITPGAAAVRSVVLLPDGRTARLVFAPGVPDDEHTRARSPGTKARVRLTSGAHLSFDPAVLILVREHC